MIARGQSESELVLVASCAVSRQLHQLHSHGQVVCSAQGDVGSRRVAGPPLYYINLAGNNLAPAAWTTKRPQQKSP